MNNGYISYFTGQQMILSRHWDLKRVPFGNVEKRYYWKLISKSTGESYKVNDENGKLLLELSKSLIN